MIVCWLKAASTLGRNTSSSMNPLQLHFSKLGGIHSAVPHLPWRPRHEALCAVSATSSHWNVHYRTALGYPLKKENWHHNGFSCGHCTAKRDPPRKRSPPAAASESLFSDGQVEAEIIGICGLLLRKP